MFCEMVTIIRLYKDKIRLKCINVSFKMECGTSKVFNECWNCSNYFIYDVFSSVG